MGRPPKVSDSEWRVMKVIWAKHPATASDVIESLSPSSSWKPKTIMTLLNRLTKKGALAYEKRGRAYHYYPLVEEAECVKAESQTFLQRVHGGALKPMLANFLEDAKLSDQEIEELKALLDQVREDQ